MNIVDIALGVLLLLGFYSGWKQGLFVALASLIGLIAGVYGAIYFSDFAAGYLSNWFDWSEQLTNLAAFAVTFLGIVCLVSMAGKFLTKIADFAALGIINKILGAAFNTLKFAFILSVGFMFMDSSNGMSDFISEEKKSESILYPHISSLAPMVVPHVLREVDNYRNPEVDEDATLPED